MKIIFTAEDGADVSQLGGKAAALAELSASGLPIPPWFAISPRAFDERGMEKEIAQAIERAAGDLAAGNHLLAVRSSAVDEDGANHSFAGQLDSFLFVPVNKVAQRVADVWQSGFSDRVIAYRREQGIAGKPSPPAVLVQQMVDAEVAGVAFAADPVSGSRSTIVVSAVFGLGTALVGGDGDCDTFRLDHTGKVIEQHIARKTIRHVADLSAPEGISEQILSEEEANRPALNSTTLKQIVELVISVSRLRGRPQDIEWALRDGTVYLLQARPITSLANLADPDGVRVLWDNSNIAESYSGITTPLTFTFARRAYDGAYRQFCKIMMVPGQVIAENDAMFSQMLGLIRGRVYYNLLNWYRLLAMLPGFSVNQRFMEQMMGVREAIPPELSQRVARRTWSQRQADRFRLGLSALGLMWNHFVLRKKILAFYDRLNRAMAPPVPPLVEMRIDQLAAEFRKLESQLISRWDAPLINDFLAMIFFGVLGKLCKQWGDGVNANLQNDLIGDEGGIISMEPAQRIGEMAKMAANDPELVRLLCEADRGVAEKRLRQNLPLAAAIQEYLNKFQDRCLEELKLESTTLEDDPLPLYRSIGHAARRLTDAPASEPFRPRPAAERKMFESLRGHPVRRTIFPWVLRHARGRVRDRENLRFERTRLFGRVRRIFVEVGHRLHAQGRLNDPRDIFYLTLDEILAFVEGTSTLEDLNSLAQLRRAQFDDYRKLPAPAERFETRGAVYLGNRFEAATVPMAENAEHLQGIGCCPGIVRGPVRIIRDPRGAQICPGEILVAERTDPGWIMLFPAAAAVLVERGSLLSHSAIVAREMGIPAIVSIPHLTQSLRDGQCVEMNGSTGIVTLLPMPANETQTTIVQTASPAS